MNSWFLKIGEICGLNNRFLGCARNDLCFLCVFCGQSYYEYDANGSVTKKTTLPISEQYPYERVYYTYDLANRLIQVKTEVSDNPTKYVVYTYNDDGIRVRAYSYDQTGSTISNKKTTVYLIDSYNHTGYAQSLEELTFLKANPNLQTDTPRSGRKYVIGDDVISQQSWVLSTISSPRYLLYDGHGSAALTTGGSTRQLAYYTGTDVAIADSYSYDGYGVLLQDESVASQKPGKVPANIGTNLLYAGEQFDTNSQQYYLRARWYNPLSGLFNQLDPYAGNTSDPQSLHKYLYCHANPVNGIDPSGMFEFSLKGLVISMAIGATIGAIAGGFYAHYTGKNVLKGILVGAAIGAATAALIYMLWSFGAACKSGVLKKFFYDSRTFSTISRQYWQKFGPASGRSLHHWLIPQRWTWIPQGIRNAGFNLLELPNLLPGSLGLNQWMGFAVRWGGTRMIVAVFIENGIRILIPVTAAASYHAGKWLGNEIKEKVIDLGDDASATPIDLDPERELKMQDDTGDALIEELE